MSLAPGAIIGGRYRVERRLGAGGVGEVWAGVRVDDGTKVAVKTLLPAASAHRELVLRFRREAEFLKRIRSKYVARVLDFMSDKKHGLVLVLELAEGEPLNEVLTRTALSVEEAIDVCWDVVGGISDLHRAQIIHRDLKPGNVIVQKSATGKTHAVIVDFGMSRLTGVDQDGEEITALTRADIAVGTMEYMAPEQILNSRGVTGAADIYALGAMLFRAVAGHHIFGDLQGAELARYKLVTDPPPLVTGRGDPLARGFEAMVTKMIQRMPKNRYERAEDVFAELALLRSSGSSPHASSPYASSPSFPIVEPPGRSSLPAPSVGSASLDAAAPGRSRTGLVVALFASLALAGIGVGGLMLWKRARASALGAMEPGVEALPNEPASAAPSAAPPPSAELAASASAAPPASVAIVARAAPAAAPRPPTAPLPRAPAAAPPPVSAAPSPLASAAPRPLQSLAPSATGASKPSPKPAAGPTPLEE